VARGDGADGLVECWAARGADGTVGVLLWNGTLDHGKAGGDSTLDRGVTVTVTGLRDERYTLRHLRVDATHGNVAETWRELGGGQWPDDDQWAVLGEADRVPLLEPDRDVAARGGVAELTLDLPMPSISLLELRPI
jgi:xylan 1,4-beta-xylosidase